VHSQNEPLQQQGQVVRLPVQLQALAAHPQSRQQEGHGIEYPPEDDNRRRLIDQLAEQAGQSEKEHGDVYFRQLQFQCRLSG